MCLIKGDSLIKGFMSFRTSIIFLLTNSLSCPRVVNLFRLYPRTVQLPNKMSLLRWWCPGGSNWKLLHFLCCLGLSLLLEISFHAAFTRFLLIKLYFLTMSTKDLLERKEQALSVLTCREIVSQSFCKVRRKVSRDPLASHEVMEQIPQLIFRHDLLCLTDVRRSPYHTCQAVKTKVNIIDRKFALERLLTWKEPNEAKIEIPCLNMRFEVIIVKYGKELELKTQFTRHSDRVECVYPLIFKIKELWCRSHVNRCHHSLWCGTFCLMDRQ